MRPDFVSVYHDPSNGAPRLEKGVKPGRPPRDHEDHPRAEGMSARRRRGWDQVVERPIVQHTVLKRWLRSRAGRRWDDVFSEACQASDVRRQPDRRMREDLLRLVAMAGTLDEDGTSFERRHWIRRTPEFWVDQQGILHADGLVPREQEGSDPQDPAPSEASCYVLSPTEELHRIDGLWYRITLAPIPLPSVRQITGEDGRTVLETIESGGGFDVLRHKVLYRGREHVRMYATGKRTLSRKELRLYGLQNEPDRASRAGRRHSGKNS